ncbi:unnamed protein product [Effrenium voratum]|nr:unnamed protein product [Effrenium voratum]
MVRDAPLRTENTFESNRDDRWRSLLSLILRERIYRTLAFWRKRFEFMSAADLAHTLYDGSKGGKDLFLDMKELVQNDQDGPSSENLTRKAKIEVFDSDLACFIDVLMLVNVSMTMVVAPLTFLWDGRWQDPATVPGGKDTLMFDLAMDIVYAVYLLLTLEMSYLHPEQRTEIVTSSKIIYCRVRSPLFWLKWLSVTCYFWAAAFGWPLVINALKIFRAGVFIELPDSLWRLRDTSEVRLTKPVLLLMGVAHWVASFLFCFGGYLEHLQTQGAAASETTFRGEVVDGKLSSYVIAYVEALYMLTGALDGPTGDGARDGNFGALMIVVVFAPIGQLVVSLFIAAIVQEQDLKNALDRRHNENKAFMQRAVQILGIPKELQRRVFSMHYFQKMSHDIEAFQILFNGKNLSGALSSALKIYLYKESVLNCKYLSEKDPNYIIEVVKILEDVVCLPGEYVARRGEIAHQMFFIARGNMSVLVPDVHNPNDVGHARAVRTLKLSDFFGEVALIKDCVRTAWIRADSYSLLSSLSRHDIEPVWKYFPEYKEELAAQVAETAAKDKKRNAQNRWKNYGLGEKRKVLLEFKQKEEDAKGKKSARASVLAAADDDESADVLASGDSAVLAVPEGQAPPDVGKMFTELLRRQSALESKFEAQRKQIKQLVDSLQSGSSCSAGGATSALASAVTSGAVNGAASSATKKNRKTRAKKMAAAEDAATAEDAAAGEEAAAAEETAAAEDTAAAVDLAAAEDAMPEEAAQEAIAEREAAEVPCLPAFVLGDGPEAEPLLGTEETGLPAPSDGR